MAPKAKKKTISLNKFAQEEYAKNALPTVSEGKEMQKGKGKQSGNYRRDGEAGADDGVWRGERGGDRGGFRDRGGFGDRGDRGGFEKSRADEGDWFKKETIPSGGFGNRGGDRDGFGSRGGFGSMNRDGGSRADGADGWRGTGGAGASEQRRPVLNLKPRTKAIDGEAEAPVQTGSKSNPFGSAAPVDTASKTKWDDNKDAPVEGGWRAREAAREAAKEKKDDGDNWRNQMRPGGDDKNNTFLSSKDRDGKKGRGKLVEETMMDSVVFETEV